MEELKRMAECDLKETAESKSVKNLNSPLLRGVEISYSYDKMDFRSSLLKKLDNEAFKEISNDPEFIKLREQAETE